MPQEHIHWVDNAKGACILLIVTMYATLGYTDLLQQDSWMTPFAVWSNTFLVPAFFFLSALFLNQTVFGARRRFLDRKIVRFAYFYLVWALIQFSVLNSGLLISNPITFIGNVLLALINPTDSLLLVYMLAVFHAVTRLVRFLPARQVFITAALAQITFSTGWVETDWTVTNQLGSTYIYFFSGYVAAPHIFDLAERISEHSHALWKVLLGWVFANAAFVALNVADLPVISLVLGFSGTAAIIGLGIQSGRAKLLAQLGYAGHHWLPIYLTFFIPMTLLQTGLAASGQINSPGLACLGVSLGAIMLSLVFYRLVQGTPLSALYRRPNQLRLNFTSRTNSGSLLSPPNAT